MTQRQLDDKRIADAVAAAYEDAAKAVAELNPGFSLDDSRYDRGYYDAIRQAVALIRARGKQ